MQTDSTTAPTLPDRQLRIVDIDAFDNDPERFYAEVAFEPVIVRGAFAGNETIQNLTLDRVEELFTDRSFAIFNWETLQYEDLPAASLFAAMRDGSRMDFNVVDHGITKTPLGAMIDVPRFLRRSWFSDSPGWDELDKSVVLTPAGYFTRLHLDSYGMQGWMYLASGRKRWTLYAPQWRQVLFDPVLQEFLDSRSPCQERFPLAHAAQKHVGEITGGDLLFFPAGWAHEVHTLETSVGVGGSLLNEYQIEEHVRSWLWERTFRLQGAYDLQGELERRLPLLDAPLQARARAALDLCDRWQARQRQLQT